MTSEAEEEWRRLHPLTVLKELASLAWTFVLLFLLDFEPVSVPGDFAGPEAVAATLVFGYAVLRYLFTAYRITDHALELRRGVLVKSYQVMPRDRVQSVATKVGFVERLVGITTVEVSAADAEDIRLSFVSEEAGDSLRRILEEDRRRQEEDEEEARPALAVASIDPRRLAIYGLTETWSVLALVVVLAVVVVTVLSGWLFAPLSVVAVLIWPVLRTTQFVGFRSWVEGDRVRSEAGLVGRRNSESPLDRIQAVQVDRPPLRRFAGRETISITTGDIGASGDSIEIGGTVAPLEPIGSWREISQALIGHVALSEASLQPSSRLTIRRAVVRGMVAMGVAGGALTGTAVVLDLGGWIPITAVVVGTSLLLLYARARWQVLGWALDDRHLLVRRGVVTRRLTVVPVHKVQDVTVRSTFFQRRLGIATVEVDTAGMMLTGRVLAIDLEEDAAFALADRLAEAAARIALPDGV